MSSLIARASGECAQYSSSIQAWEDIQSKFQDTYQTKGGPENNQQIIRSQRDVSIGSNRAVNQAVDRAFNTSI